MSAHVVVINQLTTIYILNHNQTKTITDIKSNQTTQIAKYVTQKPENQRDNKNKHSQAQK